MYGYPKFIKSFSVFFFAFSAILIVTSVPSYYIKTLGDQIASKQILLIADENILKIAPDNIFHPGGVYYNAMTFNGSIPGPVIEVDEGETFQLTIRNDGDLIHSIDIHGINGPSQSLSGSIQPGTNKTIEIKAEYPGVFVYHCDGDNLNGIWDHIASGMYGGFIVHSKNEKPANEFLISFNEIYNNKDLGFFNGTNNTIGTFDMKKFLNNTPDLILTNGMAFKYFPFMGTIAKIPINENAEVFNVQVGELTRWYIINAGPRNEITFNFAGGMIDKVVDGKYNSASNSSSSILSSIYEIVVPPGSGKIVETVFPEEGVYVGNDHDIGSFIKGAGFVVYAHKN
jgi:nitrite reductase (NO-forming)